MNEFHAKGVGCHGVQLGTATVRALFAAGPIDRIGSAGLFCCRKKRASLLWLCRRSLSYSPAQALCRFVFVSLSFRFVSFRCSVRFVRRWLALRGPLICSTILLAFLLVRATYCTQTSAAKFDLPDPPKTCLLFYSPMLLSSAFAPTYST